MGVGGAVGQLECVQLAPFLAGDVLEADAVSLGVAEALARATGFDVCRDVELAGTTSASPAT